MKQVILLILVFTLLLSGCGMGSQPEATADGSVPENTQLQQQETDATTPKETETLPATTEPPEETLPPKELEPVLTVDDLKTATYNYTDYSRRYYKLTEVCTFEFDASGSIWFGDIIYRNANASRYHLLSSSGKNMLEKTYNYFTYHGDGITSAFVITGTTAVKCELVNVETGDVLFQDENAAFVEPISDRYYYVAFIDKQTTSSTNAFLSWSSSYVYKGGSGETKYTGYALVYDAEKQTYLEGIRITDPKQRVFMCGRTLCVAENKASELVQLYFENGTSVTPDGTLYAAGELLLDWNKKQDTVSVYDCNMFHLITHTRAKPIAETESSKYFSDQYLAFYDEQGMYGVMDIRGQTVLEPKYYGVAYKYGDYFVLRGEKEAESYGVVRSDGRQVIPFAYSQYSIHTLNGIQGFQYDDYRYLPGFGKLSLANYDYNTYSLVMEAKYGDAVLIHDEFWDLAVKNPRAVGSCLVYSVDNKNAVYETIYGRKVFNGKFDYLYTTSEYIYICIDNVWTCYKLEY